MSLSLEHGTSFGDLNIGDNLSESSFLEALFGLELGHANFADDADFLLCCLFVPQISRNSTDLCPMRAGISQIMQMTQIFLQLIYHPSRFTGRNRVSC